MPCCLRPLILLIISTSIIEYQLKKGKALKKLAGSRHSLSELTNYKERKSAKLQDLHRESEKKPEVTERKAGLNKRTRVTRGYAREARFLNKSIGSRWRVRGTVLF